MQTSHHPTNTAQNPTSQAWLVCFCAALFFFYEFIQMNMFNTISPDLMRAFAIDATQLGKLSAYYFYANLLFLPIAGLLLDRFSTRMIILYALLLCVVGIGAFALSHSLFWSSVFRFMSGIGSAFCFLSSIRLASRWFSPQRMALISGLIVTMAMTGGMVAQTPLTLLTAHLGWRTALLLDAGLGLIITIIIWCVVRDYPPGMQAEHQTHPSTQSQSVSVLHSFKLAYLNYQNWLAGIYTSLLNLPVALLGAIWGSLYLQQIEHLSRTEASLVPTMLFVGAIIGGPMVGWLSDKIQNRRFPMLLGALASLAIILVIIFMHGFALSSYILLFFLLGFVTSTQVISYPLVAENNPRTLTATSISVVSFCAIGGYAVFQPLFGWLMDSHWHGTLINDVRIYAMSDYQRALVIIPLGFIIALIATIFLREKQ